MATMMVFGKQFALSTSKSRFPSTLKLCSYMSSNSFINNKSPSKKDALDSMLRVDHAGEFGAVRIYEGQVFFTSKSIESF